MELYEIVNKKAPFQVVLKNSKRKPETVTGFSKNDPLGVGGGIMPNIPCVYFEKGGWLLVADLLKNYDLAEDK